MGCYLRCWSSSAPRGGSLSLLSEEKRHLRRRRTADLAAEAPSLQTRASSSAGPRRPRRGSSCGRQEGGAAARTTTSSPLLSGTSASSAPSQVSDLRLRGASSTKTWPPPLLLPLPKTTPRRDAPSARSSPAALPPRCSCASRGSPRPCSAAEGDLLDLRRRRRLQLRLREGL